MAISITNIASKGIAAYTKAKSAVDYSKEGNYSLIQCLEKLSKYGTIVNSRYEVSFSGIDDLTFFITDINIPEIKRNFTSVNYCGQPVEVPQTIEFGHDFSMTMINDGKGMIYSTLVNWLMTVGGDSILDSGYTMVVRMLGDGINNDGLTITLNGVRFKSVSGPRLNSSSSDLSTIEIGCSAVSFTVTQGKLTKIGGIAVAIKDVGTAIGQLVGYEDGGEIQDWIGGI